MAARLHGPRGHWLAGNLEAFDRDRLGFLTRAHAEFGGLVRFDGRTTIVNDVGLARVVLKGPDTRFQITEDFVQGRLSAPEIESILGGRALLNPGLRRSVVAGVRPLVEQLTLDALTSTRQCPVDPVPVLEQVTSQAIAAYYFGSAGAGLPAACTSLLDALSLVIGNPFALPAGWRTKTRRTIEQRHRELLVRVLELLSVRAALPDELDDGAAMVVRAAARSTAGVTTERLANLIIGAMLAAHRVPAAAASWLLMLLADHPAELESVRAELREAAGPKLDLHRHPHLMACVQESLRLYPPTWLLARRSASEVMLGDHRFPSGHHFVISPYVLGRDERSFPRADLFLPARWAGTPPAATSLPFGSGPHGCPGNDLATVMLAAIASVAVSRFEIERCAGDVVPDPRTTLLPDGLRLRFTPVGTPVRPETNATAVPASTVGA